MSWRRWKLGVAVACATGFFTGMLGWGLGLTWKAALIMLIGSIGKDFILWIQDHPVASISFDTETKAKSELDLSQKQNEK